MKRILIFIIAIMLLLPGCGKVTQTNSTQQGAATATASPTASSSAISTSLTPSSSAAPFASPAAAATSTPSPSAAKPTADSEPQYTIETATFSQDDIHIEYPQINGLGDDKREKAINELIKSDILDYLVEKTIDNIKKYNDPDSETDIRFEVDANFHVAYSSNEILSIDYNSSVYYKRWPHPNNNHFGITIDLKTAKILQLTDFVNIDIGFVNVIRQSPTVTLPPAFFYIQKKDDKTLIEELNNNSDRDFYITPTSIVVAVYVPHAEGDRGLVEIQGKFTSYQPISLRPNNSVNLDTEIPLISFKIENSEKRVSVCISKDKSPYIVYRFRSKDTIELEYPLNKDNSWDNFKFYFEKSTNTYSLVFSNKGFEYRIYLTYDSSFDNMLCGIKVTDLSSGKITDIKGDNSTLIGNFFTLDQYGYYGDYIKTINL